LNMTAAAADLQRCQPCNGRYGLPQSSPLNQHRPIDDILKVFDVSGSQGQIVREATGGNPRIVYWDRSATPLGERHNLAPCLCDLIRTMDHANIAQPVEQPQAALRPPIPPMSPLHELAKRNEGDDRLMPNQLAEHRRRQLTFES
jgi:hypothetical protein